MSSINVLPDNLINKIAAGEVVERPASVVKELIENSLDADATEIIVDVEQAGQRLIRVSDNGTGMTADDAYLAFERHATSKIASEADLGSIRTLGFRGEALASIASVSRVRLVTARRGSTYGIAVEVDGGQMRPPAEAAAAPGTTIEVRHLFFNTPARLKFLKSATTELSHIIAAVSHQAIAKPMVRFKLTHNGKSQLDLPAALDLRERAFQILGGDLVGNLQEFSAERMPVVVSGLIAKPNYSRGDRAYQEFYVNGRFVRSTSISHALYEAYRDLVMRDRHPVAFLFIDIDPSLVDVNVHPSKAEVRFRNQAQVHDFVRDSIRMALRGVHGSPADTRQAAAQEAISSYLKISEGDYRNAMQRDFEARNVGSLSETVGTSDHRNSRPPLDIVHSAMLQPLAQVHDSFIVAQDNAGMALIDQHAAHERVIFEKLQDQYAAGEVIVQDLLIPLQVEVGPADAPTLYEHVDDLQKLGFYVEEFGRGTFVIKAVPSLMVGADYQRLLGDILDELKVHGRSGQMARLRDELFSVMACHPAIKVHRRLNREEMEELLRDLFACRMPHSCPHGRPTVVRFSMDEIKRMFKRL